MFTFYSTWRLCFTLPYILFIVIQALLVFSLFFVFGANDCGLYISLREMKWFCFSKIIFCFTSISFHWTVIGLKRNIFLLEKNNAKTRHIWVIRNMVYKHIFIVQIVIQFLREHKSLKWQISHLFTNGIFLIHRYFLHTNERKCK